MYCGCGDEKKNRAKLIYSKAISLPGRAPATTVTVILNTDTQVSLVKMGDFRLPVLLVLLEEGTHTINPAWIWGSKLRPSYLCS